MCIQIVERYAVCRCLYYRHAVDPCAARGQRGHVVQERTVLVGYLCEQHSRQRARRPSVTSLPRPPPGTRFASRDWGLYLGR